MRMTFEAQYVQLKGKKLLHEGSWSNFSACRKRLFAPLPSRFLNFKKFKNLLD